MILRRPGYEAFLYHVGVELGRKYFRDHVKLAGSDADKLLKVAGALFRLVGFGVVEFLDFDLEEERCVVRAFKCVLFRGLGRPASHFIRGILAGSAS